MNDDKKYKILVETVAQELEQSINELESYGLVGPVQVTSCTDADFNQRIIYVATLTKGKKNENRS